MLLQVRLDPPKLLTAGNADVLAHDAGWTGGRYGWRCPQHAGRQTNHVHRSDKGARR
jgi:hypothetical protein